MDVRLPDGTIISNVPDNTSKAELVQRLQRNGMAVPAEWLAPQQQPSVQAGSALREIPRQVGLATRYGIEGAAQLADIVTEPVRQLVVNPIARAVGAPQASRSTSQLVGDIATGIGLPEPRTADERVIADASRAVAGAGSGIGVANRLASSVGGSAQAGINALAARPVVQTVSAASGGAAGGAVREAGGGDLEQFGAALLGGVAGGAGAMQAGRMAGATSAAIKRAITPPATQIQQVDNQINLVLQRSGIDWSAINNSVKASIREDVARALNTGQPLNADALRRLVVMRQAGVTPTVGMLTQDPVQITREMNLAKTGANSTSADLQRLPQLQSANTRALLSRLDEAGAVDAPDAFRAGQKVIESLDMRAAAAKNTIDEAYKAARETTGRAVRIDNAAFTSRANQLIDEAMVGGALPPGVASTLNKIALGEIPLTVDVAEQFKTKIGKLGRVTNDRQARYALSLVRQALDEAPVVGAARVNPGNLPAIPGTIPPSTGNAGQESIAAFQAARAENAAWMRRVEANPALKAVVDGVEPDHFVKKYIVGSGATAKDLRMLASEIGPDATQAIRKHLVMSLKDAATNNTDDITKFSNDAYRRALRNLGNEKLQAFFSKEEIQQLKVIGEAGKYMQAQPAGTAVNNSGSGALIVGRGLDMLDRIADKIPLGGRDVIKGVVQGRQQTQALSPVNALSIHAPQQRQPLNMLVPALVSSPVEARDNDSRKKRAQENRIN